MPYLPPEQYLEIERKEEWKNEYYQGRMLPMPLPGLAHCQIVGSVGCLLSQQLLDRPCQAYMSALRLLVPAMGFYTYPDVTVVSGKAKFQDESYDDTLLNPTVIVEVFTKSSEAYDRDTKFRLYRSLESLAEYLLISSLEIGAERFTRQPDGQWLLTSKDRLDDPIDLKPVDCQLRLADLYERVAFAEPIITGRVASVAGP
jgi:Uma2 family endonuclease